MVTVFAGVVFFGSVIAAGSSEISYRKTVKRRDDKVSEWKQASKELLRQQQRVAQTKVEYERIKRISSLD
jgi:hypothetical protein